jgi:uncharacterized membrane protein YfcA
MIEFPVSGIETYWWLPIVVAFVISCLTSMGGISGAFLILPFQVSVLKFTGPGVSSTNLVYNIIAIPSGIYRYWREGRMVWPLAATIIIGTLPGVFIGAVIRIKYLPDPLSFKFFAGLVLLYIGTRLLRDVLSKSERALKKSDNRIFKITSANFSLSRVSYEFEGTIQTTSTPALILLSLVVGVVGGVYGVGGGAIIAPFLVAVFRLPIHTIAGATLLGTFMTSIAGVIFYILIAPYYTDTGLVIKPDWLLGGMFGIGGAAGMYVGARLQKFVPARIIKIILVLSILFIAGKYIIEFFLQ